MWIIVFETVENTVTTCVLLSQFLKFKTKEIKTNCINITECH